MEKKSAYNYDDLIKCGNGELFGPGNAKLPLPPMLMFDRITEIGENGGAFKKGILRAELDIKKELWFFDCHFKEDPVMPGCLGLDAMWQLVGFYLGWLGNPGRGRALGVSTVKFTGEVLKNVKIATYEIEMKRVLKSSGTIYLHCDPVASHYLKIIMDRLFGKSNFRSDIIWKRSQPKNDSKGFGNNNDRILMYTKSKKYTFNKTYASYDDAYIKKQYKYVEEDTGRLYRPGPLDAKGLQGGGYEFEWNGRLHLWRLPEESMKKLDKEGKIHYSSKGLANKKLYLDEAKGVPVQSLWDDIKFVKGNEDTGYPTQKPLELLRRIIETSSHEGDVVLDPFCGCATACVASQQLNRKWIGIDISESSPQIVASRIESDAGIFTDFIHIDQNSKEIVANQIFKLVKKIFENKDNCKN